MNPHKPGTLEHMAYEQVAAGNFPDMATAIRILVGVRPDLPSEMPGVAGNPAAAPAPEKPPSSTAMPPGVQPGNAPTPLPQAADTPRGMTPPPNATVPGFGPARDTPQSSAPRTYDAKGHASDGSQSVGLDNPWKIGAFEGGTYDHATLAELAAIADGQTKGSITAGEAAYILRTVGFVPDGQPDYEKRWAESRKLDRYAQTAEAGGVSPWWHDPANAPDEATRQEYGGAYGSEAEAKDNYGWWDQPGGRPSKRQPKQSATPTPAKDEYVPAGGAQPIYPQEIKPDGSAGHSETPLQPTSGMGAQQMQIGGPPAPTMMVAPQAESLRDWWTSRR